VDGEKDTKINKETHLHSKTMSYNLGSC